MRRVGRRAVLLGLALAAFLGMSGSAAASVFVVDTVTDEFDTSGTGTGCSLREAIEAASTDGVFGGCNQPPEGPDTIVLQSGATYDKTLVGSGSTEDGNATGDLDISGENLTIITLGPTGATIDNPGIGGSTYGRILQIGSGISVNISRVTIATGYSDGNRDGGGINNAGTLNLDHSLVYLNSTGNTLAAQGGGVYNSGTLHATNDTFFVNSATGSGGAIYNTGIAGLNNVTISSNLGDGVMPGDPTAAGGVGNAGTLTMSNSLIARNQQGSILFNPAQTAPDCSGAPTSLGYNLIGNPTGCGWTTVAGDQLPVPSPGLANAGAADNGGPTNTIALQPGSPAIDAGNPGAADGVSGHCASTDQRLVARPLGPRCDIGAFETANPTVAPPPPAPQGPAATPPAFDLQAALKKCKKKPTKQKRKHCRRRARHQAGLK
jgi:CSLREA domain-containing protein